MAQKLAFGEQGLQVSVSIPGTNMESDNGPSVDYSPFKGIRCQLKSSLPRYILDTGSILGTILNSQRDP